MSVSDLYDAFLIDLDGAVYVGDNVVPGAARAIAQLRAAHKTVLFVTNDSRGLRGDYVRKLAGMGIPAEEHEVITAAWAAAAYIAKQHAKDERTCFAIGPEPIKQELREAGLRLVLGDEARHASAVAVAFHEDFDYAELRLAGQAIRNGARLYGTNRDPIFPMPDGFWPATGSVLAAVEVAGGQPATVIGKPEAPIFEVALSRLPGACRVAMVGDSLFSDIKGGKQMGLGTVLVLSGNTARAELEESPLQPDFVLPSIAELI